ncbi:MAG: caspase family protein [Pseudomonadota bacterium]|nr:caspase family protein [Pseudomonadota bacterium]
MFVLWTSLAAAGVLRHALIVGANQGGGNLEPLRYAELDAERVANVLVELGGYDPAHVTVLYGPSAVELKEALHAHAMVAGAFDDDLFTFYYSGHADARGLRIGSDLYPFETLRGDIRSMDSNVKLGMLDACRSGTITRLKGAALSEPFLYEERLAAEGEAWMTATSADESAQESDKLRGSFFTHYLLSGLRGAADTGDGEVSLDEAYTYAYDRVVDHTGGTEAGAQHPNMDIRLKQEGALALTRVAQGRATATLPADVVGRVMVIRMPDRTPVAEVEKVEGRAVTLALSPGTYRFRLSQGKDLREVEIFLSEGSRITVSRWGALNAELGAPKGEQVALDALELARQQAEHGRAWTAEALNGSDLRHSPLLAGTASTLMPGAGQFYNGQWVKGGLYFAGTAAFLGSSVFAAGASENFWNGSITGPDMLRLTAAMFYGAAIADAAWHSQKRESFRPMRGWTMSTTSLWSPDAVGAPYTAGMNVEWLAAKGLSVSLDRIGWTHTPAGENVWSLGSRLQLVIDGKHLRPGLFLAVGGRLRDPLVGDPVLMPTIGGGGSVRWYITPRYFVEHELRVETEGGPAVFLFGGGLGVHFGQAG